MGDQCHLEKMGSELKCPICLCLLNSAVSLTCNHVFCNVCIVTSMKSDSTCPVCKIPFRRREVRAAPHMDNLVSIYKSMEVASGVNIFVSQNAPLSSKPKDNETHVEAGSKSSEELINEVCHNTGNKQTSKGKGSKKSQNTYLDAPGPIVLKPSSQTKKRVQVPQHQSPENTRKSAPFFGTVEKVKDDVKKAPTDTDEDPSPNKRGQQVFSPFFWLREEEDENLSQLAEGDQLLDITPPDVPSFSDLKDSDCESLSKAEEHDKSDAMDLFDSEMFEWTQRPCSPELLPSPVKPKVPEIDDTDGIQERISKAANEDQKTETSKKGSKVFSSRVNNSKNQVRSGKSNKVLKATENITDKRAKRNKDQGSGIQVDLRRTCSSTFEAEPTAENYPSSLGAEFLSKSKWNAVYDLTDTLSEKPNSSNLKKRGGKSNRNSQHPEDLAMWSKKQKLDSPTGSILEEILKAENQTNIDTNDQNHSMVNDWDTTELKKSPSRQAATKVGSNLTSKRIRQPRCNKKTRASVDHILRGGLTHDDQVGGTHASVKGTESIKNVEGSDTSKSQEGLSNCVALRKCENLANKIQCGFCHSSDVTEASGEMNHYYKGRPVSADYNAGSMVIHAHRNCSEWAPNVYFEDDTAINLEAELTRSRRIKCSCCGLKGAALGCYEKSCKRSFHVPCAKLIPQCRWDADNFVMLCPLHASSKLLNEKTESKERRRKCTRKGQLHAQHNQVAERSDVSVLQTRHLHGSFRKLVLCCSGLTAEEREVLSEFAKLPGVTVLSKWESSVTHVIASKNENGACKRTLKVLMGILEGKWILNIEWVNACVKEMKWVDEEEYEISVDVHGTRDGPRLGRQRVLNKTLGASKNRSLYSQPKLFDGLRFYLMGDFESSYKRYLQDLVVAAGGTILHRRPISEQTCRLSSSSESLTFIVYSTELPEKYDPRNKNMILSSKQSDAAGIASLAGARVVSNSWVLHSIAACKLQRISEY